MIKSNLALSPLKRSARTAFMPQSLANLTACGFISVARIHFTFLANSQEMSALPQPISIAQSDGFASSSAALSKRNVSSAGS